MIGSKYFAMLEFKVCWFQVWSNTVRRWSDRSISQTPQCIRQIFHNALFFFYRNMHTCAHFCNKMVRCEIWDWCIVGFVQQVYSNGPVFYFVSGIGKTLIQNNLKQNLCAFQLRLMPFGVALPWYQIYEQVIYCWNEWIHLVCYSLCILYINTICNTEKQQLQHG